MESNGAAAQSNWNIQKALTFLPPAKHLSLALRYA